MAEVKIGRTGFGQVEPNHLSGIVTGQIYAQLPTAKAMGAVIENGRFAKYDYANKEVNLTGAGEWMLIYNEEQHYDERYPFHKDFAMKQVDYTEGEMVPRLIKTNVGDIFTTNAFGGANTARDAKVEGVTFNDVDAATVVFAVDKNTGFLVLDSEDSADAEGPKFQIAKIYTMPDGQPGLKLVRIV